MHIAALVLLSTGAVIVLASGLDGEMSNSSKKVWGVAVYVVSFLLVAGTVSFSFRIGSLREKNELLSSVLMYSRELLRKSGDQDQITEMLQQEEEQLARIVDMSRDSLLGALRAGSEPSINLKMSHGIAMNVAERLQGLEQAAKEAGFDIPTYDLPIPETAETDEGASAEVSDETRD